MIGTGWIRILSRGLALLIALSLGTAVATPGSRDRGPRNLRTAAARSAGGCQRWDSDLDGCESAPHLTAAERQATSAVTMASALLLPDDDAADMLCVTAGVLVVEIEPTDSVRVTRSPRFETATLRWARSRAPPSDA